MPRPWLRFVAAVCVLVSLGGPAAAQPKAPPRTHDITLDDYFTQADLFAAVISPDGAHVAYVEGRWQQATDDRKTDLWVVDTKTAKARRLTSDRANDRAPQWSPDNQFIYFLGNRKREGEKRPPYDGKAQVWKVAFGGGEPKAVTQVEGGVEEFALAPDGAALYYRTSYEHIDEAWRDLREKLKHLEYGHGVTKFSRVTRLDLQTWRTELVRDAKRVIREMALAPDGSRIAMITTPDETVVSFEGRSRVDLFDLKTKKLTTL